MESPELSASSKDLEKDLTLNAAPAAAEQATGAEETVKAEPAAAATEAQPADSQVVNTEAEAAAEPVAPEAAAEPAPEAAAEPAPEAAEAEAAEPVAEAAAVPEPAAEEAAEPADAEKPHKYAALTKPELLAALEALDAQPIDTVKTDVAQIKAAFFAIRKEELAKEREAYLAAGNDENEFLPAVDPDETRIKELLDGLKEKRAQWNAEQDALKEQNLAKKQKIVEEINVISQDTDNINRQFSRVQQLQQDFKAIGSVPAQNETEIYKSFNLAVEHFYDQLKVNRELRDYDFKKNLGIKQQLCAEAENLDDEPDVVTAFHKLQELHETWRETGPVAKEIREEIWARFKNASAVINKKYQAFFEERKAREKENAEAKTALCEQIEQISTEGLKSYAAWDEATKQIIDLQAQWKKLGFASRKANNELFARFRKSCDEFFAQKAAFFKQMKDTLSANLAKKTELCEKAEALKDSTDWKATTDALVELQKEWKTIGPVAKKHSDAIWKRFNAACDAFFDNKKKQNGNVHALERENLKTKKGIIAQIKEAVEQAADDAPTKVRELMKQWQEAGHVPFKEKDKIYADYRAAVDAAFEKLDMRGVGARLQSFKSSLSRLGGEQGKVNHERERLVRSFEQKLQEIKTYENNLGFFNAKSTSGNSLIQEMERKIQKLKEESELLKKKIKLIDDKAD